MKILFFLGSGISYESGLPDTRTIMDKLLNGEWHIHTDSNFYSGPHPHEYHREHDLTPKLQNFLKYIKEYADDYYRNRNTSEANYEDIFYIVKQIHNELSYETDNPAIKFFIEHLQDKFNFGKNPEFSDHETPLLFKEVSWKAEDFINYVIWQLLSTLNKPSGFELISDFFQNRQFSSIIIATLNHDLLLENYFTDNNISYTDGLSKPDGDFCYFLPELYDTDDLKVKLIKLHGSLNWYRLRTYDKESDTSTTFYSKVLRNHWRCCNEKGELIGSTLEQYPIFLTGTLNKLADYNFGIVRDIHIKFNEVLSNLDTLIMSGYGWNDKGINGRLMEWILSSNKHKIILLHENPESIKESKSAMWHRYDDLIKWGRLIPIRKWMSNTKIEDIIEYIT